MLLNKKFIMIGIFVILFSSIVSAQTCEVSQVRKALKKAAFDYLTDPSTSQMPLVKVKDLLGFYLNIGSGRTTTDCSVIGTDSKEKISNLVTEGLNVGRSLPTCSDGTDYGECSTFKPKYCYAGSLFQRCNYCTCPSASGCTTSGKCEAVVNETTSGNETTGGNETTVGNETTGVNITCTENWSCTEWSTCSNWEQTRTCTDANSCGTEINKPEENQSYGIQTVQITTDPNHQLNPDIYGDIIVWTDNRNGNSDIYMYDLSTDQETQITTDTASQSGPSIYGNKIVWTDNRNGNSDIYMYDLSTDQETQITTDTASQSGPSIYGNKIVWTDFRNDNFDPNAFYLIITYNYDIYLYDLSTNQETQITTSGRTQDNPHIYGDKITFQSGGGEGDSYILMYDLSTNQETQISEGEISWKVSSPFIYGNKIVWQTNRFDNIFNIDYDWDIDMYDLSTGQYTRITTDLPTQTAPAIYGDKIVWQDLRNDNSDIYMYDLSTGIETLITPNTANQHSPAIYDNKIVWVDNRNGNDDIYMTIIDIENLSPPPPGTDETITCFSDSDCGTSGFVGSPRCYTDLFLDRDYLSHICLYPGTVCSICTSTQEVVRTACDYGRGVLCSNGECR